MFHNKTQTMSVYHFFDRSLLWPWFKGPWIMVQTPKFAWEHNFKRCHPKLDILSHLPQNLLRQLRRKECNECNDADKIYRSFRWYVITDNTGHQNIYQYKLSFHLIRHILINEIIFRWSRWTYMFPVYKHLTVRVISYVRRKLILFKNRL